MTTDHEASRILRERALALARVPIKRAVEPSLQVVEFQLADERYAIETSSLREVHPLRDLTPVPCTPVFVRGIVNVRGAILAIVDLRRFFALPEKGMQDLHKVLVLHSPELDLGIVADSVAGSLDLPISTLRPATPASTPISPEHLHGVTADGLVVLKAAKILSDPRILVQEEVAQ